MQFLRKNFGIIFVVVGFAGFFYLNNLPNTNTPAKTHYVSEQITTKTNEKNIVIVNVKGEIKFPGMYEVPSDLRVGDLIAIAGGVTDQANLSTINLAGRLEDEMEINIPRKVIITYSTQKPKIDTLTVEIEGAIKNPGIYTLSENAIVEDLIDTAGGLLDNADTTDLERARTLVDGEKIVIAKTDTTDTDINMIYVKVQGEIVYPDVYYVKETLTLKELVNLAGGVTERADITKINWDTELVLGAVITIPAITTNSENTNYSEIDEYGRINVNYAGVEILIQLPGIGEILAQRIIDYRSENGNFLTIEDIMLVSGIKTSVYDQIKELITV